jgi:glycosyltransferase involved in cell wall biosynthesis
MAPDGPHKVLLTGGRETGGLTSFAEALAEGFRELGIPAEIIPPNHIWSRWRDLRDPGVLKVLSTTAIFAVPFARRALCVSHGYPSPVFLGWKKFLGHVCADRLAILSPSARFITVSQYSAIHLEAALALKVDAVIPNPIKSAFLEPFVSVNEQRRYITFAGRLHSTKNPHLLLPAILEVLAREPELEALIIGDGSQRQMLEHLAAGHPRVHFTGTLDSLELRAKLRQTRVFISGCTYEALGIAYLEALSQGCNVVMPACGGGLEIAPELIANHIQLIPLPLETAGIRRAMERALEHSNSGFDLQAYSPGAVALAYLAAGSGIANEAGQRQQAAGLELRP